MATAEDSSIASDKIVRKSCELCKTRKVRCDRKTPSCTWCVRNGRRCVYTERKKPGMATRVEWQMEEKIEALESSLQSLTRRLNNYTNNPTSSVMLQEGAQPGTIMSSPAAYTLQQLPEPSSIFGHDQDKFVQESSPFSIQSTEYLLEDLSPCMPSPHLQESVLEEHQLPSSRVLSLLVNMFFKDIAGWAPLFSIDVLRNMLAVSWIDEDDAIILHGIVVACIHHCRDDLLDIEARSRHYLKSNYLIKEYAFNTTSVRAIQALTLVTIEAFGRSDGPEGHKLLALVVACLKRLDIIREESILFHTIGNAQRSRFGPDLVQQPVTWLNAVERAKLVNIVYMLDSHALSGRPECSFMKELKPRASIISSLYPSSPSNTLYASPGKYGATMMDSSDEQIQSQPLQYLYDLLGRCGQIQESYNEPIQGSASSRMHAWIRKCMILDTNMRRWFRGLPDHAHDPQACQGENESVDAAWTLVQANYALSVIQLHSYMAYPMEETEHVRQSLAAKQRCLTAVRFLKRLILRSSSTGRLQHLGYHFAFIIFVGAGLLLVNAAACNLHVEGDVHFFISTLETLSQRWPVAGLYSKDLGAVIRQCEILINDPSQIHIFSVAQALSAMRRRAHEIFLMSQGSHTLTDQSRAPYTLSTEDLTAIAVFGFFEPPLSELSHPLQYNWSSMTLDPLPAGLHANDYRVEEGSYEQSGTELDANNYDIVFDQDLGWYHPDFIT